MNHKNLDALRQMSVPELTGIYLDKLFAGSPVNFSDFDGKGIAFSDGYRSSNFSDLKISDANRQAVLDAARLSAENYASARNRNSQPANLIGFDQNLVKATRDWVSKRRSHMRGTRKVN